MPKHRSAQMEPQTVGQLGLLFQLSDDCRKRLPASDGVRVVGAQTGLVDLEGALVQGAIFHEANLFRADGAKMKGDDRTSFKGANVKQVRVVPNRGGHE